MNWDTVAGNCKKHEGKVADQWGKFTDDHLRMVAGHCDHPAGNHAYGAGKEQAEPQNRTLEHR